MANTVEVLPQGDYKITNVGPSRDWEFKGDNGTVEMTTDSVQLEGYEQYWIDLNRSRKADPPKIGDSLTGTATQDEAGKYPPKFNKPKGQGGGFRGGRGGEASPGAKWASAVDTAQAIVSGYYLAAGKKPKTIAEYLSKVEAIAPKVNAMVDKLVAAATPAAKPADATNSEAGESPAPAAAPAPATPSPAVAQKAANVVIEDIGDEELGDW